jgi:hypothetical protein
MLRILKMHLEGKSPYRIARELDLDPPNAYATLKRARRNFAEADKMLTELKALGWPDKLGQKAAEAETEFPMRLG